MEPVGEGAKRVRISDFSVFNKVHTRKKPSRVKSISKQLPIFYDIVQIIQILNVIFLYRTDDDSNKDKSATIIDLLPLFINIARMGKDEI